MLNSWGLNVYLMFILNNHKYFFVFNTFDRNNWVSIQLLISYFRFNSFMLKSRRCVWRSGNTSWRTMRVDTRLNELLHKAFLKHGVYFRIVSSGEFFHRRFLTFTSHLIELNELSKELFAKHYSNILKNEYQAFRWVVLVSARKMPQQISTISTFFAFWPAFLRVYNLYMISTIFKIFPVHMLTGGRNSA